MILFSRNSRRSGKPIGVIIFIIIILIVSRSSRRNTPSTNSNTSRQTPTAQTAASPKQIDLPQAEQRLCTAVMILLDTSGSMENSVSAAGGEQGAKSEFARQALKQIFDYTATWQKSHPDKVLLVGLSTFSSAVTTQYALQEFSGVETNQILAQVPRPAGGTAIGLALQSGYEALYQSGCVRKHIICITDGENTSGPAPARVARQLYQQTGGEVELHFIAFDISARYFSFVPEVSGHVVEAASGAILQQQLSYIYEKQILAEAQVESSN
ncbi:MAG: hypothetical protein HJJLKODD_00651 [Phycisphaerae bacterium]|nr:hypothetical protein [Phycisphaerae bacterium]